MVPSSSQKLTYPNSWPKFSSFNRVFSRHSVLQSSPIWFWFGFGEFRPNDQLSLQQQMMTDFFQLFVFHH
jgi:hypothetical protein